MPLNGIGDNSGTTSLYENPTPPHVLKSFLSKIMVKLAPPARFVSTRMTVLDNGFISRKLPASNADLPEDIPQEAYWGYQNLATSYNTGVSGYALDICLEYELSFLDEKAKKLINLETTWLDGLWYCTGKTKAQKAVEFKIFVAAAARLKKEYPEVFKNIRNHPYTIIPANTGNHWETVFIELEREEGQRGRGFKKVKRIAIIDPKRHLETTTEMERRLKTMLEMAGLTVPENCQQEIMTRYQRDHSSCGLFAYQIIKTLLHRIDRMVSKKTGNHLEAIWAHMNEKPFVAEKVRAKMRGICAEVLLRDCDGLIRAVFVQTKGVVPYQTGIPVTADGILYPGRAERTVSACRADSTAAKRKRCDDAENEGCELSDISRPMKRASYKK